MSQENVEIVRSLYERLNAADDVEAAMDVAEEVIDPEIEFEISWRSGRDAADFRVLHGIEEVRTVLAELMAPFASFRWEIHESFDAGDEVVLILESLVTPNDSAAEISTGRFGYVFTLRDGKIARCREYATRAEALEAAGLRE
jgi:ketosteroid isomerase-like protein